MAAAVEQPTRFTFPTLFSKFYGSALPRPYLHHSEDPTKARVDPPSINGAFLEWAAEANWKMGGFNTKGKKLQGKIEGKLEKLDKDQKKRSSSSSKKKSAKRRRQNVDSDEEEDKDAAAETETEDESGEDAESESEDADLADESGSEDELESHIRSRTRSGSKRAKEHVRKVLQYDVADRVEAGARAEPSGLAAPVGSSRTRQLRKKLAATPKSRTPSSTRLAARAPTPVSAKSDAKKPTRRSARVSPVALPSASSGDSDEETHENVPDHDEDVPEDVPADDFSDGSDDERTEDQEEYPATDEEEENEYE